MTEPNEAQQETWVSLLPPGSPEPPLITREQLFDELTEREIRVSERTLMYWESIDVLPRPVRRHIYGKTQAVYPEGWEVAVYRVIALQNKGYALGTIGETIRAMPFFDLTHIDWTSILKREALTKLSALAIAVSRREGKPTRKVIATIQDEHGNIVENLSFIEGAAVGS